MSVREFHVGIRYIGSGAEDGRPAEWRLTPTHDATWVLLISPSVTCKAYFDTNNRLCAHMFTWQDINARQAELDTDNTVLATGVQSAFAALRTAGPVSDAEAHAMSGTVEHACFEFNIMPAE